MNSPALKPLVTGLFHVAIKTADLAATDAFYTRVIGLSHAHRPDFGYPGSWLAVPTPVGEAVIHIYAGGPALRNGAPVGSAAIDHLSLTAVGFDAYIGRFKRAGLPWREFIVPNTTYWQLFIYDPSGVQLELTFDARAEGRAPPTIAPAQRYDAGNSFFDPACYQDLEARLLKAGL
jgi:catechol 2,3-dioxygenase-like lactoylglutathione lyase family enzyme